MVLTSSSPALGGRRRCAVNGVSFVVLTRRSSSRTTTTSPVSSCGTASRRGPRPADGSPPGAGTPVFRLNLHEFVEVVFQNTENELQSWHLDGYDFWVVKLAFTHFQYLKIALLFSSANREHLLFTSEEHLQWPVD